MIYKILDFKLSFNKKSLEWDEAIQALFKPLSGR